MHRRCAELVLAGVVALHGCGDAPTVIVSGDPANGAELIRSHGCGSCHQIPGIRGADGLVGPPLEAIGRRAYLGGVLPNHYDTMVRWLLDPHGVDPRTAMPAVGLTEPEAADIAAYLHTLR